jgi:large subunit ribosomal protein L14
LVQKGTQLKVADNSGAKIAEIIGIPGSSKVKFAYMGDIVRVSVKRAMPHGTVEDHSKQLAVIVRLKTPTRRKDGSYIRFDDNALIIIDGIKTKKPIGTRVFGPVARELKDLGFDKIISLAPEVL